MRILPIILVLMGLPVSAVVWGEGPRLFGGDKQDSEACEWLKDTANRQQFNTMIASDISVVGDFDGDSKVEHYHKYKGEGFGGTCSSETATFSQLNGDESNLDSSLSYNGEGYMNSRISGFSFKGRQYVINHFNDRRDDVPERAYIFKTEKFEPWEHGSRFPLMCVLKKDSIEIVENNTECKNLANVIQKMNIDYSSYYSDKGVSKTLDVGGVTWKARETSSGAGCGCDNIVFTPMQDKFQLPYWEAKCGGEIAMPIKVDGKIYYSLVDRDSNPIALDRVVQDKDIIKTEPFCQFERKRIYNFRPVNGDVDE